jgi:glycosyltransferase involved in cell wall biosynthesis
VDLHVAAPSRWLLEQARSSPIFEPARSFSWIPYGMPSERLYPIEQQLARRRLGLAPDRFVVAFGAMSLSNRRKGARELQAALGKVAADREVCGLVFGAGEFGGSEPMPEIKHVGPISDDATRRDVYSAADLFVLPSLEDNLPLTGLEAMACATPVLGFRSGGIPDYVRPHETGILVDRGDAGALGEALEAALRARDQLPAMGQRARQRVLHQFESRIEAGAYCRLYEQVLADGLPSVTRAA